MGIDYDSADFWFGVLQWLVTIAVAVYAWFASRSKANKDAIAAVEKKATDEVQKVYKKYDELRDKHLELKGRVDHLPDQKALGEVHYRIDQVGQGVQRLEGSMEQINNNVQLIMRTLMDKDGP